MLTSPTSDTSHLGTRDGRAIVYCQHAFQKTDGKTAHGLVRRTRRYEVLSVIDQSCAGRDAAELLDGAPRGIPIFASLTEAMNAARERDRPATHFVIGLAPDGGRLDAEAKATVRQAIEAGLNVDAGLHDFLSDDPELARLAVESGVRLRDVRKTPPRSELHPFTGKIAEVRARKVAVLGTDSACGKRTTCWCLVDGLAALGLRTEMIGTGQTAWLQGARYGLVLDSLINDFVAGELEHAVWTADRETACDVVIVEGQGSLLHPAYPGGFEILAATKPDVIVLQHAPARKVYDGFPGRAMDPLAKQLQVLELVGGRPVAAITINHESLATAEVPEVCRRIEAETGIPTTDVLLEGPARLADVVRRALAGGTGR